MITQEEKVDQVRRVTLDCQWGTAERLPRSLPPKAVKFATEPNTVPVNSYMTVVIIGAWV